MWVDIISYRLFFFFFLLMDLLCSKENTFKFLWIEHTYEFHIIFQSLFFFMRLTTASYRMIQKVLFHSFPMFSINVNHANYMPKHGFAGWNTQQMINLFDQSYQTLYNRNQSCFRLTLFIVSPITFFATFFCVDNNDLQLSWMKLKNYRWVVREQLLLHLMQIKINVCSIKALQIFCSHTITQECCSFTQKHTFFKQLHSGIVGFCHT